jgi:hypothetical protein
VARTGRWQLRFDADESRLAIEGLVIRLAMRIGLVAATLLVLGGGWIGIGNLIAGHQERLLDQRWATTSVPLHGFGQRFPPREANAVALRIEDLAARLGLRLCPRDASDRSLPDSVVQESFETISEQLTEYVESVSRRTGGPIEPPPAALQRYLSDHSVELEAIREALIGSEPPSWKQDLSNPLDSVPANLLGHYSLQRLLAAASFAALAEGRPEVATRGIEAAWRLGLDLHDRPEQLTRLIAVAIAILQAAVIRDHPEPDPLWIERLLGHDWRAAILVGFQSDAWVGLEAVRRHRFWGNEQERGVLARLFYRAADPYLRLQLIEESEVIRRAVEELPQLRFDRFDAAEAFARNLETPSLDRFGRIMLPDEWMAWDQVNRAVLYLELVSQVTAFRHRQDHAVAAGTLVSQPSRHVPGITWTRRIEGNRMTISPAQELAPTSPLVRRRLSLRFSLELDDHDS